ncbi:MAG TPA: hypothetical protein VK553_10810, partial [Candidatus Nitrosopolaris rasttigaisensis]|nr:hypothetical protein [Candidatus Nitrosopolaris rasttigaisensis]
MEESQKLNKARVEEQEKLVDKQSDDAPTRDKGTNNSNENNTNTNGADNNGNNRKHKHQVQTIIPKKDKGNENPFAAKLTTDSEGEVAKTILQSIPTESQVTSAKFEGPNIALYTKNAKFSLTELTYYLSSLSKSLKKRFVIRTDPSIRIAEDETRKAVVKLLPKDVLVSAVFCDDATGEV